jgi:hypothetical protein
LFDLALILTSVLGFCNTTRGASEPFKGGVLTVSRVNFFAGEAVGSGECFAMTSE